MEMDDYQTKAKATNQYHDGHDPTGVLGPILGLSSESGSIVNSYKKYFRGRIDHEANRHFLKEELGDLLWYLAIVSDSQGFRLSEIAEYNLLRTQDRYSSDQLSFIPELDKSFPDTERFPRQMVIKFEEITRDQKLFSKMSLVKAVPNAFPDGKIIKEGSKHIGYTVGDCIGNEVSNNSRRSDAYRYHDAVHIAMMTVLGWSPLMRALLRVKRKSNEEFDNVEDGARAIFLEEGLVATLAELSKRRMNFFNEETIDGEVLDIVTSVVGGLEVSNLPTWLWRSAITQGFSSMNQLGENHGGYLVCDLNKQSVQYHKHYLASAENG